MNFHQNGKRGVAVWHMISLLSGSRISLGPQIICQTARVSLKIVRVRNVEGTTRRQPYRWSYDIHLQCVEETL